MFVYVETIAWESLRSFNKFATNRRYGESKAFKYNIKYLIWQAIMML